LGKTWTFSITSTLEMAAAESPSRDYIHDSESKHNKALVYPFTVARRYTVQYRVAEHRQLILNPAHEKTPEMNCELSEWGKETALISTEVAMTSPFLTK
jgi:hypothetical protein